MRTGLLARVSPGREAKGPGTCSHGAARVGGARDDAERRVSPAFRIYPTGASPPVMLFTITTDLPFGEVVILVKWSNLKHSTEPYIYSRLS